MTFGAPAWLFLLGLLPLLIALHMRRKRPVDVGSLFLWLRAGDAVTTSATRRSALDPSWSLILQALAVALLAVGLADPRLGSGADGTDAGPSLHLVDASAAMTSRDVPPDRFAAAIDQLSDHLQALRPGAEVGVVLVGERPHVVRARGPADRALTDALRAASPTHAAPDWHAAARIASALVGGDPTPRVTVWTAPENADRARGAIAEAIGDGRVTLVTVGTANPPNAGLADVDVRAAEGSGGRSWTVTGSVVSQGLAGQTIPVTAYFRPDGTERALSWARLEVTLDASERTPFDLSLDVPDDGALELRLPEGVDAYGGDDSVWRELRPSDPIRVLRVGPDDDVVDAALLAIPTVELYGADTLPPNADAYDLVILDGTSTNDPPATSVLWLGAHPLGIDVRERRDPAVRVAMPGHPLLGGYDASDLRVDRALEVPLLAGSDVILADDVGAPLLQARMSDTGLQAVVAFDVRDSSWPGRLGFPAFLAAVVDAAVPDRDLVRPDATRCRVGTPCGLPAEAFAPGWSLLDADDRVAAEARGFRELTDDPLASGVWTSGTWPLQFVPDAPGRYRMARAGTPTGPTVDVDGRPYVAVAPESSDARPDTEAAGALTDDGPDLAAWLLLLAALVIALEALRSALRPGSPLRRSAWQSPARRPRAIAIAALVGIALASGVAAWNGVVGPHLTGVATTGHVVVGEAVSDVTDGPMVRVVPFDARPATDQGISGREGDYELAAPLDEAVDLVIGALRDPDRSVVQVRADRDLRLDPATYLGLTAATASTGIEIELPAGEANAANGERPEAIVHWRIDAPIRAGGTARMVVTTDVAADAGATLIATWADGPETRHEVPVGRAESELALRAPDAPGARALDLRLVREPEDAAVDSASTVLTVAPAPRLLILSEHEEAAAALAADLRLQGLDVETRPPRRTPSSLDALSEFDVALLLDVTASSLHSVHQERLEAWVRTRGGGLIVTGGERSFGAGGYFRTTLEDLSPLSARIPDEKPEATLVFVLDRSGSMQARVGPVTRLDIAKEATTSSFELLAERSRVGVVAFDTVADTIAAVAPLSDRPAVEAAVASISPGGGTSLYPALVLARDLMRGVDSATKHVIVLTDGLSQPGDFEGVLSDLRALDVTTSFIGIGDGADRAQLARLAELGDGSFHMTLDFRALPGILAQETLSLASDPIERDPVAPTWTDPRPPFLTGIDGDPPPLAGHVRTSPKPEATVHLVAPGGDPPLLASWRYGLGRVVAFASQAIGPWSASWRDDPEMRAFWPQLARWTAGNVLRPGLRLRTISYADRLDLLVTARGAALEPLGDLDLVVRAIDPGSGAPFRAQALRSDGRGGYAGSLFLGRAARDVTFEVDVAHGEPPEGIRAVRRTVRYPPDPALRTDAAHGEATLARLAEAAAEDGVRASARWRLPVRLAWSRGRTTWAIVMVAAFLASLVLRYQPFGWGPGPRRRVGA